MTIATPVVATGDEPEPVQPNSRRGARDDSGPAPERAPDLQLLGSEAASGHRRPPSLVRRGDGQTIQLTPLLYAVTTTTKPAAKV